MEEALRIRRITAGMILDSRGNPTIEAHLSTKNYTVSASAPSGASTGLHEAKELRDNNKAYNGLGVSKAIRNVEKISTLLKGVMVVDQERIDSMMIKLDNTSDKSRIGANAMLAVSIAAAKAAALHARVPLYKWLHILSHDKKQSRIPVPYANIINGGMHAGNNLSIQEFMIAPVKAKTMSEATMIISETYHELKKIIIKKHGAQSTGVGDEGGFAPPIKTPEEALNMIESALKRTGYDKKTIIAIDAAASSFYDEKTRTYNLYNHLKKNKTPKEMLDYYKSLVKSYNIKSIEDPFYEEDFGSYAQLTKSIGSKVQVIGDDITTTNPGRIEMAAKKKSINSLLLKPNQIGTVTETLIAVEKAYSHKWKIMASHRSGETEEHFIADLAVGIGCGQIKLGGPTRGERTAKYNQLLRIEDAHPKMPYGGT
ncbi:MAG: phosphopyruvate hydratase [Candidatus Woesearchaeota archaeon]